MYDNFTQHGYWPGYHSNDIRWSGSNSSNNTNAATAGPGNLSDPAAADTYGNESDNFRKRHRDAPRHRAENFKLGKSDSRDGADARDDFNTLPGIDDDSASTGSIGAFSMGSLGMSAVCLAFLSLPIPCNVQPLTFNWKMQVGRRLFCPIVCHPKIASAARERDEARRFTDLNMTILTTTT